MNLVRTLMTGKDVERALHRITDAILECNRRNTARLALIGIHTGGVFLAQRIRRRILELTGQEVPLGVLDINLYRDDWTRRNQYPVVRKTELTFSVDGRGIVLIDDVLYTGRTVRAAMDALMDFGRPDRIELAVLVDRGLRELPIMATYRGESVLTTSQEQVYVDLEEHSGRDEVRIEAPQESGQAAE
ncbi:MAG: bifunctional pyr operon transcriptional regulator/uracil phosphoribosyltransferase PyrR [Pseudomonadota bacterium]